MKPIKSGLVLAQWLLRITIMLFLLKYFLDDLKTFDFASKSFYIGSAFVILGVMLFIGGFLSKPSMTIISGMIIALLSLYKIVLIFSGAFSTEVITFLIPISVGFYFACSGNQ